MGPSTRSLRPLSSGSYWDQGALTISRPPSSLWGLPCPLLASPGLRPSHLLQAISRAENRDLIKSIHLTLSFPCPEPAMAPQCQGDPTPHSTAASPCVAQR